MLDTVVLSPMQKRQLTERLLEYAASDTVCYFAPYPASLKKRQQEKWLPLIDWVNEQGCDFKVSETLAVPSISEKTKAFLMAKLEALDDFSLACFNQIAGGCRSIILAFAVTERRLTPSEAFDLSVLEETYQNEFWKKDEEALEVRESRKEEVLTAGELLLAHKGKK